MRSKCPFSVRTTRFTFSGVSKGKGFAGVMKRHGFSGGRATHGSMFHRAPGSIGMAAYPARVLKGTKGPGQMGNKRVTVKNLQVVEVNEEENLLLLKGRRTRGQWHVSGDCKSK